MAPCPAEDGAAGAAAELQRLQHEIRAAIKERSDLEQRLANPDALRAATARGHRDRDAATGVANTSGQAALRSAASGSRP